MKELLKQIDELENLERQKTMGLFGIGLTNKENHAKQEDDTITLLKAIIWNQNLMMATNSNFTPYITDTWRDSKNMMYGMYDGKLTAPFDPDH